MGSKFDFRMSRSDYDDLCFDLTDDEHAVLDLRRRGMHNADIAAELYCSERTVNRRVKAIKIKLGNKKPPFVIECITNGGFLVFIASIHIQSRYELQLISKCFFRTALTLC